MFDLVADVERYPEFLPLCEGARVRRREERDGHPVLIAEMTVGYKAIRETFTSRALLIEPRNEILVSYVDGPFRHLENRWAFRPIEAGCLVEFRISYEFRSPMLGLIAGAVFDKAFRRFAEAFEMRAREIYGTAPPRTVIAPGRFPAR